MSSSEFPHCNGYPQHVQPSRRKFSFPFLSTTGPGSLEVPEPCNTSCRRLSNASPGNNLDVPSHSPGNTEVRRLSNVSVGSNLDIPSFGPGNTDLRRLSNVSLGSNLEVPLYGPGNTQLRRLSNVSVGSNLDVPSLGPGNTGLRRLSNVSDAVSRKFSTTLGWRSVSVQEVVNQARSLCGQYIRAKLKRCGISHRKLGLQRLRSVANLPGGVTVCEVFQELHSIGAELERMHPDLYTSICRQVCVTLTSEKTVHTVFSAVARELFRAEVTWGKIVSLYGVAGGLAVDCVRQGHPEYLLGLVEVMGLVVERDVATWIASQGGWTALLSRFKEPAAEPSVIQVLVLGVAIVICLAFILIYMLRVIGKMAFPRSEYWT